MIYLPFSASGKLKRKVKIFKKDFYADVVTKHEEKRKIFDIFHNSNIGGHGGKTKTRYKIAEKYYWPGLSMDIEKWVRIILVKVVSMNYFPIHFQNG